MGICDSATAVHANYPKSRSIPHFEQRLDEVNRQINAVPYVSDEDEYREESFWQTPVQSYRSGGECRDYAVAKYHALYALGVADADMQFAAVRIRKTGQFHAVLIVRYARHTYILDNRHAAVLPASAMAE